MTEIFIRRPVMTTLIMAGILLFGIMGYRVLPVSDLPTVDFPTIQVSASLPGANPDTMASSVATPLEKQFSTIAGIDNMTSTSAQGTTQITIQFSLDRNIDAAAQDVQAAISLAQRQLPPGMPTPPSYRKVNPADQPILFLALSSPTLPLSTVAEYAETHAGAADLDGQRRRPGPGLRLPEVRGAGAARPDEARVARDRDRRRRAGARRAATSTCPRARCRARTRRSPSRPAASCSTPPPTAR